jgi:hypothetical protein
MNHNFAGIAKKINSNQWRVEVWNYFLNL